MAIARLILLSNLIFIFSVNAYWENVTPIDTAIEFQYAYCYSDSSIIAVPAKYNPINLMFISRDNGKQWDTLCKTNIPTYTSFNKIINYNGVLFASLSGGYGLIKSDDTGKTWKDVNTFPGGSSYSISSTSGYLFTSSTSDIYRSADTGKTWKRFMLDTAKFSNILAIETYGDTVFAAGYYNFVFSTNFGSTWVEGGPGYAGYINLCRRNKNILAGAIEGVFLSRDIGKTWEFLLGGASFSGAGFFVGDSTILMTMQGAKTYISYDWGKTITEFKIKQDQKMVFKFASNNYYMFACAEDGLYRFPVGGDVTKTVIAQKRKNNQYHVRGCNGIITINNQLKQKINYTVFNARGIKVFENKADDNGNKVYHININSVVRSKGLYFVRLCIGNELNTIKCLIK